MCLVINKVDLLFTTLKLTPEEAYENLRSTLASVNVIMSSLVNADQIEKAGLDADGAHGFHADDEDVGVQRRRGQRKIGAEPSHMPWVGSTCCLHAPHNSNTDSDGGGCIGALYAQLIRTRDFDGVKGI